jgi:hypothetical protein
MNAEVSKVITGLRSQNGKLSGKGPTSYVVCAEKGSNILLGCFKDHVYILPLLNNMQELKETGYINPLDLFTQIPYSMERVHMSCKYGQGYPAAH